MLKQLGWMSRAGMAEVVKAIHKLKATIFSGVCGVEMGCTLGSKGWSCFARNRGLFFGQIIFTKKSFIINPIAIIKIVILVNHKWANLF